MDNSTSHENITSPTINVSCIATADNLTWSNLLLYAIFGSVESVVIVFSNVLILASLFKFPRLRQTCNLLIGNLAISDLLVGALLLPVNLITVSFPAFADMEMGCILKTFNWVYVMGSSFLSLFLISIDRLFAILCPIKYKTTDTQTFAVVSCFVCWTLWTFSCLLTFIFNTWRCSVICTLANVMPQRAFQFVSYFLGLVFIISLISFIIIVMQMLKLDSRNALRGNEDVKRTSVMVLVFGLFVIFLIPIVISAVYASTVDTIENRLIMEWLVLIAALNSVVNGAIYGWRRPEFRKAYLRILPNKRKHRIAPSDNSVPVINAVTKKDSSTLPT